MESATSLRLPVQSPPVSRVLVARQGHQHPGGIEAAARECEGAPPGPGNCYDEDGNLYRNDLSCGACCNTFARGYWVAPGTTEAWECTVGEVS